MKKIIACFIVPVFVFFSCANTNELSSNSDSFFLKKSTYTLRLDSGGCNTYVDNLCNMIDSNDSTYTSYQIVCGKGSAFQHVLISFPTQTISQIFIKSYDSSDCENSESMIGVNLKNVYDIDERVYTAYSDNYLSFDSGEYININKYCDQVEIYFSNNNISFGNRNIRIYEINIYNSNSIKL